MYFFLAKSAKKIANRKTTNLRSYEAWTQSFLFERKEIFKKNRKFLLIQKIQSLNLIKVKPNSSNLQVGRVGLLVIFSMQNIMWFIAILVFGQLLTAVTAVKQPLAAVIMYVSTLYSFPICICIYKLYLKVFLCHSVCFKPYKIAKCLSQLGMEKTKKCLSQFGMDSIPLPSCDKASYRGRFTSS